MCDDDRDGYDGGDYDERDDGGRGYDGSLNPFGDYNGNGRYDVMDDLIFSDYMGPQDDEPDLFYDRREDDDYDEVESMGWQGSLSGVQYSRITGGAEVSRGESETDEDQQDVSKGETATNENQQDASKSETAAVEAQEFSMFEKDTGTVRKVFTIAAISLLCIILFAPSTITVQLGWTNGVFRHFLTTGGFIAVILYTVGVLATMAAIILVRVNFHSKKSGRDVWLGFISKAGLIIIYCALGAMALIQFFVLLSVPDLEMCIPDGLGILCFLLAVMGLMVAFGGVFRLLGFFVAKA